MIFLAANTYSLHLNVFFLISIRMFGDPASLSSNNWSFTVITSFALHCFPVIVLQFSSRKQSMHIKICGGIFIIFKQININVSQD